MLFLLFILSQIPKVEFSGKLNIQYTREDNPNKPVSRLFLHYGIITLTFKPRDNLKVIYSNDLGFVRRFCAEFFIPRLKCNINVGKFSIPFGLQLMDHTSLLEDNIGLGLQRDNTGIGITLHPFFLSLEGGIFPCNSVRLYTATVSMKPWICDIGIAYLLDKYSNDKPQVNRKYYEYYAKIFIPTRLSLLWKYIPGNRMNKKLLGSNVSLELPFHPLFSPFVEYELFDPDRSLQANSIYRTIVGLKYVVTSNAMLRLGYYINREETKETKNNLLSLMAIVWW
ncbi:MAG: hypothetical protein QMD71_08690 [bacterium]|nr:hypothetical protein [bacterium]